MNEKEKFYSIHINLSESDGRKYVLITRDVFSIGRVYEYTTNDELKEVITNYITNMLKEESNA